MKEGAAVRQFNYYLYDNDCSAQVRTPEDDPRGVLNEKADGVLTAVVEAAPGTVGYADLCGRFSCALVDSLIHIGLLRKEDERLFLDSTVIVEEDAAWLRHCFSDRAARMAEAIVERKAEFYGLAEKLDNGFPPRVNLYHLLCGAVLDGDFFECLSEQGVVATSRTHESGLDYLIIAYEKSQALDEFSRKQLCSYNRFTDGTRALQSFGDADGNRADAFLFSRQKQLGKVPRSLKHVEALWDSIGDVRKNLLDELEKIVETGRCEEHCRELLCAFGYIQSGRAAVPVYRSNHQPVLQELEALTENCILDEMKETLSSAESLSGLRCIGHGVPVKEIANELYHVVFGQINEQLAAEGFVENPPYREGEGRYLQSIELM